MTLPYKSTLTLNIVILDSFRLMRSLPLIRNNLGNFRNSLLLTKGDSFFRNTEVWRKSTLGFMVQTVKEFYLDIYLTISLFFSISRFLLYIYLYVYISFGHVDKQTTSCLDSLRVGTSTPCPISILSYVTKNVIEVSPLRLVFLTV